MALLLPGCDDESTGSRTDDAEFLPLKNGWFQIYDVEEIVYQLGVPETLSYQLKSVVVDSFQNVEGSYTYLIHRSTRSNVGDPWTAEETWSARVSAREAVVSEGSTSYIVLKFPPFEGAQWNGNELNDLINPNTNTNEDIYTIETRAGTCVVNNISFDGCVAVLQEDNEEFVVYHDERREIYARNVGLIYKETIQLHYCNDEDRNCVGQQMVDDGIIYRQMISSYGAE
jgi:hypothetical protein